MVNIKSNNMKVDKIYTSESLKEYKPKKEFYTKILNDVNLSANEVVFVGDSLLEDVQGPQSVGIYSILIDRKGKYDEDERKIPDAVIRDLRELDKLLADLNNS